MQSAIIRHDDPTRVYLGEGPKEAPMKLASLALLAGLVAAGYASAQTAQTPSQSSSPPSSTAPEESSSSGKMDKACKQQIKKLCGHAHGQEMQDCVKSGIDMNKFSADCTSAIKAKAQKSKS
jgi:uncharacterized protein (DUF2252 family)